MYFKDGWHRLSDVYNVTLGAWVTLTYLNLSLCLIKLKDLYNVEIEYPKHTPPLSLKLQRWFLDASASNGTDASVSLLWIFFNALSFLSYIGEDFDKF